MSETKEKKSWFGKLRDGLKRSSSAISSGITDIFTKRKLDDDVIEELEELLISGDLGVTTAARIAANIAKTRYDKEIAPEEIRAALADEVAAILDPVAIPFTLDESRKPHVALIVGVNGSGKTTTIGKFAKQYRAAGKKVVLAAGDTFRAAAVEQLQVWGQRTGCDVVTTKVGGDAAGLAYSAMEKAKADGADLLLIDTAGRLQNKSDLMAELEKVLRVIKKLDPDAPHSCLLVLDATTGQNALNQVEIFGKVCNVTGLVMTKLDGTARGGVLVAIADRFGLPVHAIGVGEGEDDLQPFAARDFARALSGVGSL
ncbi:signal recognition particle-docking protein FtsY [Sneathiella chungangensis]|uniref:Signal recognition particle receptor FtsY n=1 Tax=Sneathiella chungangensis TaxID=1418234 RepID=A0A845MIE3_9PROT|nr:signal recognition particle-docking protein FtsY [Sneathiella chungangensis]MZR23728.1 signal recognition particle-docking protein FtsY [Sneathiella chungangensis]